MILAVDVGNSNIVMGCIQEGEILFTARLATDRGKTSDEYAILFHSMIQMRGYRLSDIEGGIISSVVPVLINVLKEAMEKGIGKTPLIVGPGIKTGLNIAIDNPAQLGSDLAVGAVAALAKYPAPLIVFDMGTATTLSVIDRNKRYIGGSIFPGVRISLEALSSRTSLLPGISLEAPKKSIGSNTIDCMQSGLIFGSAAMLDGMIDRAEEELGYPVTIVATGGLAKSVISHCRHKIIFDDDLLLNGLWLIYQKNT